ncbi:hypothetical protein N7495_005864 [Penicillium taxi]|uniref:uncharacterized protein n=1 Tax=Penicillium taxi TaxID=168475 RepID=UPI0025450AFE|nr:uncharacterized protein N7495_005864 [Penicillium taxi]KAJ5894173.1 hypothetical protein N7495_005864 [Penicillium taxi]
MSPDRTNLDRLARVRDNQRNSRARKQEHVKELEKRLAIYEDQDRQKDIEHRLAIQKLEADNQLLKTLLDSLGVSRDIVQQYLLMAEQGTAVNRKVAIPPLQRFTGSSMQQTSTTPTAVINLEHTEKEEIRVPPLCKCPTGDPDPTPVSHNSDVLNTTLCAIAEELISQYNVHGVDLEEIRHRLRSGFCNGNPGDGCRVQNNLLFQVLDEISNTS